MADDICLGCGLGLDAGKRLEVRVDGTTVMCEDDGSGTGGTHLVAKGLDAPTWPFACNPEDAGYRVYADANGILFAGPKPWETTNFYIDSAPIPNINTLLQGNSVVLRQLGVEVFNDEPCNRPVCVHVDFVYNGFGIEVPANSKLFLTTQFTTNGGLNWTDFAGFGFNNTTGSQVFFSPGASPWLIKFNMAPGAASRWVGMRWMTHPAASSHQPGRPYAASTVGLYSIQMKVEKTTLCHGWGIS